MKGLKEIVNNLANRINQPHYLENELKKVFNNGVEWERNRDKWISVKDRPPEEGDYLAVVEDGDDSYLDIVTYSKGRWIICPWEQITHWMPLPKPPKKDTK